MKKRRMIRASLSPRALVCAAAPLLASLAAGCATLGVDAVSTATSLIESRALETGREGAHALVILAASKRNSTGKIADAIARELGAAVASPENVDPEALGEYELIGFGSGIFDQMHHKSILDLADRLPARPNRRVFLFSTSGVSRRFALDHGIDDPHTALRDRLSARGCEVVGEYNCAGFNDNSFLWFLGGMNKGKPDKEDVKRAAEFARKLKEGG